MSLVMRGLSKAQIWKHDQRGNDCKHEDEIRWERVFGKLPGGNGEQRDGAVDGSGEVGPVTFGGWFAVGLDERGHRSQAVGQDAEQDREVAAASGGPESQSQDRQAAAGEVEACDLPI